MWGPVVPLLASLAEPALPLCGVAQVWHLDETNGRTAASGLKWIEDTNWTLSLDAGWNLDVVRRREADAAVTGGGCLEEDRAGSWTAWIVWDGRYSCSSSSMVPIQTAACISFILGSRWLASSSDRHYPVPTHALIPSSPAPPPPIGSHAPAEPTYNLRYNFLRN